jgi:hypothetical protein
MAAVGNHCEVSSDFVQSTLELVRSSRNHDFDSLSKSRALLSHGRDHPNTICIVAVLDGAMDSHMAVGVTVVSPAVSSVFPHSKCESCSALAAGQL